MSVEAAIVGGGPAGAALATLLARAGRDVVLLEREPGPHDKVCGEFISGEAAAYLTALGLELTQLGAVPIRRVRLAGRGQAAEAALPFTALSLSRRRLDEALLALAAEAGAQVRRGLRVRGVEAQKNGWRLTLSGSPDIDARTAILAVGKHDLKALKRPPGLHRGLVGFKMHLRLTPAQTSVLSDTVEIYLFPGGYAGLEPIEDGLANLCLVTNTPESWPDLVAGMAAYCPLLSARLTGAQALWSKPLAIAAIPYGHVATGSDGLWRIGDQAAVIPSFAGDGLGIALHSAHAAADAYLDGLSPAAFQRALSADISGRVRGAAMLSRLLVQPWAQPVATALTRLRPQLLSATAAYTRIPDRALKRLRPAAARPGTSECSSPSGPRSDCPA